MEFQWIYFASNAAMPGLIKIGFTVRSPTERLLELDATGVPVPFQVSYAACVDNAHKLERLLHRELDHVRVRPDREFFQTTIGHARGCLTKLCADSEIVLYFDRVATGVEAEAEEQVEPEPEYEDLPPPELTWTEWLMVESTFLEAIGNLDEPCIQEVATAYFHNFCEGVSEENLHLLRRYLDIPLAERKPVEDLLRPVILTWIDEDPECRCNALFIKYIYGLFESRELTQAVCEHVYARRYTAFPRSVDLLGLGAIAYFCADQTFGADLIRRNARGSLRYFEDCSHAKFVGASWQFMEGFWAILDLAARGEQLSTGEVELVRAVSNRHYVTRKYWPEVCDRLEALNEGNITELARTLGSYHPHHDWEEWSRSGLSHRLRLVGETSQK